MLPLHSQNTAAIKLISLGRSDFKFITKRHVFDKQASTKFAEFLNKTFKINLIFYKILY